MKGRISRTWRWLGIGFLLALTLRGPSLEPLRSMDDSACRFSRYYRAFENDNVPVGFWGRVVFSLLLAGSEPGSPATSSPSSSSPRLSSRALS